MENLKINTRTANGKWIFSVVLTVLFHLTSLAQDPADFGSGDNPTDAPGAPIDGYVWVLMGIGIGFSFFKYKAIAKKSKAKLVS